MSSDINQQTVSLTHQAVDDAHVTRYRKAAAPQIWFVQRMVIEQRMSSISGEECSPFDCFFLKRMWQTLESFIKTTRMKKVHFSIIA